MSEPFKIFIDRLKGGHSQKIDEALTPSFLGPDEKELRFPHPVHVKGEAYLTDDDLIVHLKAKTMAVMPCAICNQMINVDLKVDDFYHTQQMEEIPSAIFNYGEALREALLLELPRTVECKGKCPERASMEAYMRSEKRQETYLPFADLDDIKE